MKKSKILVADDSQEVMDYVVDTLKNEKYNVLSAYNPEEAVKYNNIDLLITDLCFKDDNGNRKNKDGFYIIESMKSKHPKLPIILMSSGLNKIIMNRCKNLGVKTFPKYEDDKTPVNKKKLLNAIEDYLI